MIPEIVSNGEVVRSRWSFRQYWVGFSRFDGLVDYFPLAADISLILARYEA